MYIIFLTFLIHSFGVKHLKHKDSNRYRNYVFIDVGGNIGDTMEKFLRHGVYGLPKPSYKFDHFYVFEPSPDFHHHYEKFKNKPYNFTLIPSAASSVDGVLYFAGNGEGGSTIISSTDAQKNVSSVDFSRWLNNHVILEDYVVCKIDAEGSEYEIIQRMFADGTLCLCDRLTIEWHGWLACRKQPVTNFNNITTINSDIPGVSDNCTGAESVCMVPHLNLILPHYYCTLPRVLIFARNACVGRGVKQEYVLENHDIDFFKPSKD